MRVDGKKPNDARIAAGLAALLGASGVQALDWSHSPTVSIGSGTDSNLHLSVHDEREVTSSRLDVGTSVLGASDRLRLSIAPRINAIDYSDERELDRRDRFLATSLGVGGERHYVSLSADFGRDGTLTSALEESGFTQVDANRDRSRYSLGWTGLTSEHGTASLRLSASDVRYEEFVGSPLVDYEHAGASFTYAHALGERVSIEFGFFANELETEIASQNTENAGLSLALAGDLSESLEYRIGTGRYRSRYPGIQAPVTHDTTFEASLAKRWESWRVTTSLVATVEPSAHGVLYRREGATIDVNHRFTEFLDAGLRVIASHVVSDQPLLWTEDRYYAYAQLSLNWRFAERLSLSLGLGTRGQEYVDGPRARSAYGQIGITYRGRRS